MDVRSPRTLRDRKKRATSEAIVRAAYQLFGIEGFDAVTIERVADAAGVSPRTVYRYFPTKAAIVFDVQASWMAVFASTAAHTIAGESVLDRLRRISSAVAQHVQGHAADALLAFELTESSPELQAVSLNWERDWRVAVAAEARTWSRRRAVTFAGTVMGMISATLGLWLEQGADDDLAEMIDRGFDAIEHGWADASDAEPEARR